MDTLPLRGPKNILQKKKILYRLLLRCHRLLAKDAGKDVPSPRPSHSGFEQPKQKVRLNGGSKAGRHSLTLSTRPGPYQM